MLLEKAAPSYFLTLASPGITSEVPPALLRITWPALPPPWRGHTTGLMPYIYIYIYWLFGAVLAPVSRHATESLRQGAALSQKCFAILCLFVFDFRGYNHGLKGPQKPKTYCDKKLLRYCLQQSQIDPWPRYLVQKHHNTPPICIAILLQKYALFLAESSIYTTNLYHDAAPICIRDTFAEVLGSGVVGTSPNFLTSCLHCRSGAVWRQHLPTTVLNRTKLKHRKR